MYPEKFVILYLAIIERDENLQEGRRKNMPDFGNFNELNYLLSMANCILRLFKHGW